MGKSKFMFLVFMGVLFVLPAVASTNSYTLEDALKKHLVTASINGGKDASPSYYGKCITVTLKNTTNQNLSINLENGRRLVCIYDSVQDMIVTRAEIFALLPAQSKEYTIYAMCSQKHDRSPHENSVYQVGVMAESVLVELTLLIEQLNAQDYTGQNAVWVITDDSDPSNINGDNAETVKALKDYVTAAKAGKKQDPREKGFIYDYSYPTVDEDGGILIEGDFDWQMPYKTFVSLYVYDNYGNRVKVIFQDVVFNSGLQTYHYKIKSKDFRPGELYWVRMKSNDKTLKELAIQMD